VRLNEANWLIGFRSQLLPEAAINTFLLKLPIGLAAAEKGRVRGNIFDTFVIAEDSFLLQIL
jgi:hypothetical protein